MLSSQNACSQGSGENEKHGSYFNRSLFTSDSILSFSLEGRLHDLFADRNDNRKEHPVLLKYNNEEGQQVSINLFAKTRGHFRRMKENCFFPPVLLHFTKTRKSRKTLFRKQTWLKLVMPCGDDELVVREYLVYKIYNLVTVNSFQVRLAKVTFVDSLTRRKPEMHYCFLVEDAVHMAKRLNGRLVKKRGMDMKDLDTAGFLKMAVFQYMVGNTDWSVPYLQNIFLLNDSSNLNFPVPYDFDHAGIVRAPYALPAPELGITSTLERLYRGYCMNDKSKFDSILIWFGKMKPDIYELYKSCTAINKKYMKATISYLDEFYKLVNNTKLAVKEFNNPCTLQQRVEIRGLKQ